MFEKNDFDIFQANIINKFNLLAARLRSVKIDVKNLNLSGICNGLSYRYASYASQDRRAEFLACLNFIELLSTEEITKLVEDYRKNPDLEIEITFKAVDAFKKVIPFKELIKFFQDINLAQLNDNIKNHIGANCNWDKVRTFMCDLSELESKISCIEDGDRVFIALGMHIFYIERSGDNFYLFDDRIKEELALYPLLTRENLVAAITKNYREVIQTDKRVAFSMRFISFANKNNKDEKINHWLSEYQEILNSPNMSTNVYALINAYHKGKMCGHDFALILLDKIKDFDSEIDPSAFESNHSFLEKLMLFKDELEKYVEEDIKFFEEDLRDLSSVYNTAFTWEISLLYLAAQENRIKLVEILIAEGADVNQLSNGYTPLYAAASHGHTEVVKALIERDANNVDHLCHGFSSLHTAAENNYIEIVEALLEAGANINQPANDGRTPLHFAVQKGNIDIVKTLLKADATNISQSANDGRTPLHIAVQDGNVEIVKVLSASKVGVDEPYNGFAPLHIAVGKSHVEIVKILLAASKDSVNRTYNGFTPPPLHVAVENGNVEIVEALLKAGANINQPANNGNTPLYFAVENRNIKIIELLLEAGANINQPANDGRTPLHIAVQYGNVEIVKVLLAASSINIDQKGMESLFKLINAHSPEVHKELTQLINDKCQTDNSDKATNAERLFTNRQCVTFFIQPSEISNNNIMEGTANQLKI
jgi:ankyrin repeat protein